MQSDIMERECCVINHMNKLTIKNIIFDMKMDGEYVDLFRMKERKSAMRIM